MTLALEEVFEITEPAVRVLREPWFQRALQHAHNGPALKVVELSVVPETAREGFTAAATELVEGGPGENGSLKLSAQLIEWRHLEPGHFACPPGSRLALDSFGLFAKARGRTEAFPVNRA